MTDKVDELEAAMLAQAERLADQYREQARQHSAGILAEARERLHLREQRETQVARERAERAYRRQVQARELALQAKLDGLRFELVRGVQQRVLDRLRELAADEQAYLALVRDLVADAAAAFDAPELVIECRADDRARLAARLDDLQQAAGTTRLSIGERPLACSGGVLLRTPDDRVRLDQTFEGRMHRLAGALHRVIQQTLLPESPEDHNRHIVS